MPSILSRHDTTIEPPSHVPRSKRTAESDSPDDLPRGCTARNSRGTKKKRKIVLVHNEYYNIIVAKIGEVKRAERTGRNRLVTIGNLGHAADSLLCKECVKEEIEGERKQCVEIISNYLAKNKNGSQDKKGIIDMFTALLKKNASRRTNSILQCSKVQTRDNTVGIGSHTGFCCAHGHDLPLSPPLTHHDANGISFVDYEANAKAIIQE